MILGRCCNAFRTCNVAQKGADLLFAHLDRVALAVEKDKSADPSNVRLFDPDAVMPHPDSVSYPVEKFRFAHFPIVCYTIKGKVGRPL